MSVFFPLLPVTTAVFYWLGKVSNSIVCNKNKCVYHFPDSEDHNTTFYKKILFLQPGGVCDMEYNRLHIIFTTLYMSNIM